MSFLDKLTHLLPQRKKEEKLEYFFAVNIGAERLTAALWAIEGKSLKILDIASDSYTSNEEIITVLDKLLDAVLGLKEIEPQKILFGVPNSWILDDNLKDEYLKILRRLVKELELTPMAYVATSHALIHFLEKQEGVPVTAILTGFDKLYLTVTVVRAGKLDGMKVVKRGETAGADIEKALLQFTDVETLPSRILIYGPEALHFKSELLSFPWMSKLSFLHFPKIEVLGEDLEIKSVCLAGGAEIDEGISYMDQSIGKREQNVALLDKEDIKRSFKEPDSSASSTEDLGFVVGDVSEDQIKSDKIGESDRSEDEIGRSDIEENDRNLVSYEKPLEVEDFEQDISEPVQAQKEQQKKKPAFGKSIPGSLTKLAVLFGIIGVIVLLAGAYVFLLKADVKVFVEPKTLEKDAQVIADPTQKKIDEEGKIIPGQIVKVEVSGSAKDTASGKKQIGDPAKGTVVIRNKTDSSITLSKGITLTGNGQKFTLDVSVTVASRSADDGTWGKANGTATAVGIGADGNISSGTDMTASDYSTDKIVAKSEGNFSGGTSKDVTVVSSEDQQRLLAKLSSDLRQQAQQKLQEKYPNKKILAEALSEQITSKSYSKNLNDQANEFSLNMTVRYTGTGFDDADLRTIVSKLVNMQVPDGFQLDLSNTETQADVSKLEKDGKLIFLARFKAKMLPKIDSDKIKNQIKFKTPGQAGDIIKGMDNVLGSEIKISPNLPIPDILKRLPFLTKNINVEIGLK